MKLTKILIPLATLTLLASCGETSSTPRSTGFTSDPTGSSAAESSESSSAPAVTYEAYTLSQIHDARKSNSLKNLDAKYISVKGKVTFAFQGADSDLYNTLVIQSGKYALLSDYPASFKVNVGDSVELKGKLILTSDDAGHISLLTSKEDVSTNDIRVVDEAIEVETVTGLSTLADLAEYDCSKVDLDFKVADKGRNGSLVCTIGAETEQFTFGRKLGISESIPSDAPYAAGDTINYKGLYVYNAQSSLEKKLIQYLDLSGLSKKA